MIDLLIFSATLADNIADATHVKTLTDAHATLYDGEITDMLILSTLSTDEAMSGNAVYTVSYRLAYVYAPESMTAEELAQKRHNIGQAVADYINSIPCYTTLADAVILQSECKPWDVSYGDNGQISYILPLELTIVL